MMNLAVLAAVMTVEIMGEGGTCSVERVEAPERDGIVRFTYPAARVPKGVRSLTVTPDFAEARAGEPGYWVFPNNAMGTFRLTNGHARCGHTMMSMYGMKTPRRSFCAIVEGMRYSFSPEVEAKDGVYRTKAVFHSDMDDVYEDLSIEYRFLPEGEDDYSDMARCYRAYQLGRGACRPLAERIRGNPVLAYAATNIEVRVRQAWKPVPSPVEEQVTRNEPPVRAVITFDRFREIVDESVRQGVTGAEFCLVGWNAGGHDGRYPQIFPVEPALGGEEKLKASVAYAQAKGYQVVGHSSFRDCYMIADTWDAEYVVEKNPDGTLRRGKTTWGGGRLYTMCPQRAYERFCPKQCAEMATLGFSGLFYVDVVTSRPLFPCRDPRHRLNNSERAVWENNIMRELQRTFGGSASESGFDFCAGTCDSALNVQWVSPLEPPRNPIVDGYAPVWQMVYNGIILSNPFRSSINGHLCPDRRCWLKTVEFGGRPTFYWYANFANRKKTAWGSWDMRAGTDAELRESVAWMKRGCDEYARRSRLQFAFMDRHERIAAGVVRTTYSDGTRVCVNYNDCAVRADGVEIPALDYAVVAP